MAYWLALKTPSGSIRSFPIEQGETTIGRGSRAGLRIALPSIATRQCTINLQDDRLSIRHCADEPPTLVNGTPTTERRLEDGDEVTIGPVTLRVYVASMTARTQLPSELPFAREHRPAPATHDTTKVDPRPESTPVVEIVDRQADRSTNAARPSS